MKDDIFFEEKVPHSDEFEIDTDLLDTINKQYEENEKLYNVQRVTNTSSDGKLQISPLDLQSVILILHEMKSNIESILDLLENAEFVDNDVEQE